jgi:hypothetical protein
MMIVDLISPRRSEVLDGCPMFAVAYMGRKTHFSNAFTLLVDYRRGCHDIPLCNSR